MEYEANAYTLACCIMLLTWIAFSFKDVVSNYVFLFFSVVRQRADGRGRTNPGDRDVYSTFASG